MRQYPVLNANVQVRQNRGNPNSYIIRAMNLNNRHKSINKAIRNVEPELLMNRWYLNEEMRGRVARILGKHVATR